MRENPPLIERGGASSARDVTTLDGMASVQSDATSSVDGPAIHFVSSDGETMTITGWDILVVAALVQTLTVAFLAYREVKT